MLTNEIVQGIIRQLKGKFNVEAAFVTMHAVHNPRQDIRLSSFKQQLECKEN